MITYPYHDIHTFEWWKSVPVETRERAMSDVSPIRVREGGVW